MKKLPAIVLGLLLFWVQVFVMAQPVKADAPAKCTCCACNQTNCCVTKSAPAQAPLPVAPAQTVSQNLNLFSITASIAWMLPRGEAGFSPADNSSSLVAARVPLFHRDCALLI